MSLLSMENGKLVKFAKLDFISIFILFELQVNRLSVGILVIRNNSDSPKISFERNRKHLQKT